MGKPLTEEEITALDTFRAEVLDACLIACANFEDNLNKVYPKLETEIFIDLMEQAIEDFTKEALDDEDDIDFDENDGSYIYP